MTDNFVHFFLFQDSEIKKEGAKVSASFVMDLSKEGWVGIPHGGIGMGSIMELAAGFANCADNGELRYPVHCSFRMGGAEAHVGDQVGVDVVPTESGISGRVSIKNAAMPYITGDISVGNAIPEADEYTRPYVPENFAGIEGALDHLPYYRNCFVCGVKRTLPGLKRQFHLWKSPHGNIVCAFAGFKDEDQDTIYLFEKDGFMHPIGLLAILDETMGWGGFFASANGGVSVRLNYTLKRKININEKLVFFGRGEKVMGRIDKRMMFWASGCAAVMRGDGSFEVVIKSSGQWVAMASLTDQMEKELIPEDLTRKAFAFVRERA